MRITKLLWLELRRFCFLLEYLPSKYSGDWIMGSQKLLSWSHWTVISLSVLVGGAVGGFGGAVLGGIWGFITNFVAVSSVLGFNHRFNDYWGWHAPSQIQQWYQEFDARVQTVGASQEDLNNLYRRCQEWYLEHELGLEI